MKKQNNAIIGIYKITNPSGKVYVGQSIDIYRREKVYRMMACKNQPKIFNSIKKYGWSSHSHEILEECSLSMLNTRELYWKEYYISSLGWENMLFCDLSDTGAGGPRSDSVKQKCSVAMKGRKKSPEHIQKMKDSRKGKSFDKVCCPSCGKMGGGGVMSRYHFDNCNKKENGVTLIRKGARTGIPNKNKKKVIQYDMNGNFIAEWDSQWQARDFFNLAGDGIGMVCRGKQKSACGYLWKYKE